MKSATVLLLLIAAPLQAQRDSVFVRDSVTVTAERTPTLLGASTSSVTRLEAVDIALLPGATIADVLRQVPGFALVNFDGSGYDPQVVVRGFYGAGEAEYVTVLVDGRPVNQLHSGVVSWDALPVTGIEAVEVLRGSGSSLYGDAAVGAVINIITGARRTGGMLAGGSHGTWRGAVAFGNPGVEGNAAIDRTDGWRTHAQRTTARGSVRVGVLDADALTLDVRGHKRELEEPGALLLELASADATSSDDLFRFDATDDRMLGAALSTRGRVRGVNARALVGGEIRDIDATRTLALAPGFGDTRARDLFTRRLDAVVGGDLNNLLLQGDALAIGVEASTGEMESTYWSVMTGTRDDYRAGTGNRGERNAAGNATRASGAVFASYTARPIDALRVSLGVRQDWLSDDFTPEGSAASNTDHSALSPKAGINFRYSAGGHVFANVGRTFKAPTLDQLFDQRPIPIPVEPFSLTTSNPDLVPQRGTSVEGGIYQAMTMGSARLSVSASLYQIDMRDELDFDVTTLKFVNIGRSRHRGIEAGARVGHARASGFATYTLQSVTIRSGENMGNGLKAIPHHTATIGATASLAGFPATASITHSGSAWLDDANTQRLPGWTRIDTRIAREIRGATLYVDVRNLLDERYSTVAFFDPSGSGAVYEYPAAGRSLEIGVRR